MQTQFVWHACIHGDSCNSCLSLTKHAGPRSYRAAAAWQAQRWRRGGEGRACRVLIPQCLAWAASHTPTPQHATQVTPSRMYVAGHVLNPHHHTSHRGGSGASVFAPKPARRARGGLATQGDGRLRSAAASVAPWECYVRRGSLDPWLPRKLQLQLRKGASGGDAAHHRTPPHGKQQQRQGRQRHADVEARALAELAKFRATERHWARDAGREPHAIGSWQAACLPSECPTAALLLLRQGSHPKPLGLGLGRRPLIWG